MSDFKRAKDDLLFFSKRFKGILDIIPDLEKISNINNYIKEKEKTLKNIALDEDQALEDIEGITSILTRLRHEESTIIDDAKQNIYDRKVVYEEWEQTSHKTHTILLDEERRNFDAVNKELVTKIASKRKELEDLVTSTKEAVDRYNTIKQTIDDLRGRL